MKVKKPMKTLPSWMCLYYPEKGLSHKQTEKVTELLHNIYGLAQGYDCVKSAKDLRCLIDDMRIWAGEALDVIIKNKKQKRASNEHFY